MKLDIAVISLGGKVNNNLCGWLLLNKQHVAAVHFVTRFDIICARNEACKLFVHGGSDALLMVNDDVLPTVDVPTIVKALDDCDIVGYRMDGPGGEKHLATIVTSFMVVTRKALEAVYDYKYGWFPPPIYGADGCDWTACECATFYNLAKAKGLRLKKADEWVGHRHETDFNGPPKVAK